MPMSRHAVRIAALCAAPLAAHAGVVELGASRDNTLYEYTDAISNGAGQYCFTGRTAEPSLRRTLMAFDIQGSLPPGVHIRSAALTLNMSKTIAGPSDVSLHRALADWGQGASDPPGEEGAGAPAQPGDATWVHTFYDTYYWSSLGGDYAPGASATTSVGAEGAYTWTSSEGMLSDVRDWFTGSAPNHGWVILGDESGPVTAKRFDTREHPDPASRPRLQIAFTPPCAGDWTMDGAIDTRDVIAFLNEWAGGYHSADLNQDGVVNTLDVIEFLNAWNAGCP
ncbi:MAG TPA: GC-type dockerin domain-anchored protein [Phycisphaerales bacterium]|nr:GC-type dockerin domain-anchored protein [Phycisphaerales bacterium]